MSLDTSYVILACVFVYLFGMCTGYAIKHYLCMNSNLPIEYNAVYILYPEYLRKKILDNRLYTNP